MPAASGEINNYGSNPGAVSSGQKVKTSLPAFGYIVIIAVFLVVAVVGAAGIYGGILRKRRLARWRANNHEMFAPIMMGGEAVSTSDTLRWTDTSEKKGAVVISVLPRIG
jgi:hypothetical protein